MLAMSLAIFWRRRRLPVLMALALGAVALSPAYAEHVTVNVDQARVMRLPQGVATVVIGNPLIADATLQGGVLVLTGKGYGTTNLVALGRDGQVVTSDTVEVVGPKSSDLVVVYKGTERESYSCSPVCERRITLGDGNHVFLKSEPVHPHAELPGEIERLNWLTRMGFKAPRVIDAEQDSERVWLLMSASRRGTSFRSKSTSLSATSASVTSGVSPSATGRRRPHRRAWATIQAKGTRDISLCGYSLPPPTSQCEPRNQHCCTSPSSPLASLNGPSSSA